MFVWSLIKRWFVLFPLFNIVASKGKHITPTTNCLPFAEWTFFHITPVDMQLSEQNAAIMTDWRQPYLAILIAIKTRLFTIANPFKWQRNQSHRFVLSTFNFIRPAFCYQMPVILYELNFSSVREIAPRDGRSLVSNFLKCQLNQFIKIDMAEIDIPNSRVDTRQFCFIDQYGKYILDILLERSRLRLLQLVQCPAFFGVMFRHKNDAETRLIFVYGLKVLIQVFTP